MAIQTYGKPAPRSRAHIAGGLINSARGKPKKAKKRKQSRSFHGKDSKD